MRDVFHFCLAFAPSRDDGVQYHLFWLELQLAPFERLYFMSSLSGTFSLFHVFYST